MQINRELLNSAVYRIAFYPQSVGAIKLYTAKPQVPTLIGEMNNDLVATEIQLNDMLRIANNYDFEAVDQNGDDILKRKTNVANAAIRVMTKAMEIVGGEGFYRGFGATLPRRSGRALSSAAGK